jgi:hypothetical protein
MKPQEVPTTMLAQWREAVQFVFIMLIPFKRSGCAVGEVAKDPDVPPLPHDFFEDENYPN